VTDGWEDHSTLLHRRADDSAFELSRFEVRVVDGPDRGNLFTIVADTESRTMVGTSPACAIRLTDRKVSRRHIALNVEAQHLHLTDLSSTNGTVIGGVRVLEALLVGGETVLIGDTKLEVRLLASAPSESLPEVSTFGRFVGGSAEASRKQRFPS
jgi:two-component system, NtrC family, response regulator HydG